MCDAIMHAAERIKIIGKTYLLFDAEFQHRAGATPPQIPAACAAASLAVLLYFA